MKRRVSCLLLCILTAANCMPAYALTQESNVTFSTGGMKLMEEMSGYNVDGKNYMPLRAFFEMLGGEVDYNEDKKTAKVVLGDLRIIIDTDNMTSQINGEPADLDLQMFDGRVYLPVRLLGETLGFVVKWDEETKNIDIKKGDSDYILLNTKDNIDEDTRIITFEEARELAQKKSSNIKNINDNVDYLKDTRDNLGQTLTSVDKTYGTLSQMLIDTLNQAGDALAVETQLQSAIDSSVELARSMKNVDVQSSLLKVNEQMVKDGIDLTLVSQVSAIKGTEIQMQLLEESIKLGKEDVENTRLKNELGYASDVDLKKAELKQEENEKNYDLLVESLKTQKEALNYTLGLNADEKVYIVYDAPVKDYSDFKLDLFISRQLNGAPSIKVLEGDVTIAEYAKRTNPALINESSKSVRNKLNTASRALEDGKEKLEKTIRANYHQIQQLVLKDKQLRLDVEQAVTDYNSAVVSYNAGLATAYTVKQARLGVLNAEKAVEDNRINYNLLTESFEKSYLSAAGK